MRETCHPQELTITRKSLGLFWKGVTLNNLKRLLLKTLMGEFRIQNNTVDRFLIRSSPQAISSGSNVSTHFNVKIPSVQNVGILELLTSLITFRHLYQERKDGLKFFTPSLIKLAMPCRANSADSRLTMQKRIFPFVGSRQQLSKVQLESVTVEDSEISFRNLGAWFDGHSCEQCQ